MYDSIPKNIPLIIVDEVELMARYKSVDETPSYSKLSDEELNSRYIEALTDRRLHDAAKYKAHINDREMHRRLRKQLQEEKEENQKIEAMREEELAQERAKERKKSEMDMYAERYWQ